MIPRLLDVLDDASRAEVLRLAVRRRFARNEVVFHQGDPGESMHLVTRGGFEVRAEQPLGHAVTVRLLQAGEHFGELALVSGHRTRTATIVALEPSETLMVGRDDFDRLRRRHPSVDALLVAALAERVEEVTTLLVEFMALPVDKRVYRRLVILDRRRQRLRAGEDIVISQQALADMVGATRPTVNRALQRAVERNVIRVARGRIAVLDRGTLERWGR